MDARGKTWPQHRTKPAGEVEEVHSKLTFTQLIHAESVPTPSPSPWCAPYSAQRETRRQYPANTQPIPRQYPQFPIPSL